MHFEQNWKPTYKFVISLQCWISCSFSNSLWAEISLEVPTNQWNSVQLCRPSQDSFHTSCGFWVFLTLANTLRLTTYSYTLCSVSVRLYVHTDMGIDKLSDETCDQARNSVLDSVFIQLKLHLRKAKKKQFIQCSKDLNFIFQRV